MTAENYKDLDRPAFGSVRFSFTNSTAWCAAGYATKYLIKVPEYGFPDWVLDYVGRVPRYGHSRGFFPKPESDEAADGSQETPGQRDRPAVHDDNCFCDVCRGETGGERREFRTLRERLAVCKAKSTIVRVEVFEDREGRRTHGRAEFVGSLNLAYSIVCDELGCSSEEGSGVEVDEPTLDYLRQLERHSVGGDGQCFTEEDDW